MAPNLINRLSIALFILLFPAVVFAGSKYNSNSGHKDFCITIKDESGTVESKQCGLIEVPDGYLEEINGGFLISVGKCDVVTKTSDYTIINSDCFIICDATSGKVTLTLPTVFSSCTGTKCRVLDIKKIDSTDNACVVDGNGSETIDDGLIAELASQYESIKVQGESKTSTKWWIK